MFFSSPCRCGSADVLSCSETAAVVGGVAVVVAGAVVVVVDDELLYPNKIIVVGDVDLCVIGFSNNKTIK